MQIAFIRVDGDLPRYMGNVNAVMSSTVNGRVGMQAHQLL
jgi:hypothetical protein